MKEQKKKEIKFIIETTIVILIFGVVLTLLTFILHSFL